MPPRSRTAAGPLIAGTIIFAAIGVIVVLLLASGITPQRVWESFFPIGGEPPVTDRGHATRQLYDIVFYIAAAIFLAVEGVIIYTAFRYRRKPGDDELPPQTHGNNLVEVIWTAIPLAIVLFLFVMSWQTLQTVDAKTSTATDVHVRAVAARFQWEFQYLDGPDVAVPDKDHPAPKVLYSQLLPVGEEGGLFLPVGEPVTISLSAKDVIHAFYVPKFLFKRDVVPGKLNTFEFTIDTAGTYRGQCAELCGAFHGSMVFDVHALPRADYDAWLADAIATSQQTPAPPPSGGPPPAGEVVQLAAKDTAFTTTTLSAKPGAPFTIHFTNDDTIPHDVKISDAGGADVFHGPIVNGGEAADYQVPALAAGTYPFVCTIHANMTGTLTVQ